MSRLKRCVYFSFFVLITSWMLGCSTLDGDSRMVEGSDHQITMMVRERLESDPFLKFEAVHVSVDAGVVTLKGLLSEYSMRMRILGTVQNTEGVLRVVDELQ